MLVTKSLLQPVAPHGAPAKAKLVEVVPTAAEHVGAVVRFRKILASETGVVLGLTGDGQAEIVNESGEVTLVPIAKIKKTIAEPSREARSLIGRLMRYLTSDAYYSIEAPARVAQGGVVRARIEELKGVREHAIALLMDRQSLSLSLPVCLALPIEPWRVRYEFLAGGVSSEEVQDLAASILADPATPASIRALIALKFSMPLSAAGPEVEALFSADRQGVGCTSLAATAQEMSEEFGILGLTGHTALRDAAVEPARLAAASQGAAIIAALSGDYPSGRPVEVDGTTPLAIVDDLVDRRIQVAVAMDGSGTPVDPHLHAYLVARTDPARLATDDVVTLGFGDEALRRYLAGDTTVEPALPAGKADDVKALRLAVAAGDGTPVIRDPLLRELRDVLVSRGAISPSEMLLADYSTWRELIDAGVVGSSRTGPLGERFVGVSALTRAAAALHEWRWEEARSIAREGLREVRAEEVRDELLNIVACALWLSGEPEPALAALDNALEGAYTDALLINASVVATELEHDSAIDRFVKLAREAPTAHQRAVAAERALVLWDNDDARIWDDDDESLPVEIRDALRPLIREHLPEDRYLRVLRTLANRDSLWLAAQSSDAFGSNVRSTVARVFRARAKGLDRYIEALSWELRATSSSDWIMQERDALVEAATRALLQDIEELPAAFFGLTLLDSDLAMTPKQSVPLKCLTVVSVVANVVRDEGEPNLRFIDLVTEAKRDLDNLTAEDREKFRALVEMAGDSLGRAYLISRAKQMAEAHSAFRLLDMRISTMPRRHVNWQAVRQVSGPISEFCTDTYNVLSRVRPLVDDGELRTAVIELTSQASSLGSEVAGATR